MAKTKISEFSATAADNTDISNINIAEGCSPANVNNAIRSLMAVLKSFEDGSSGDNVVVGGNLSVTGTSAFTGNVTAPTQSSSDNSTKVATTAFVVAKSSIAAITSGTITGATINTFTVGANSVGARTVQSTSSGTPTGGSNGDIVYQY